MLATPILCQYLLKSCVQPLRYQHGIGLWSPLATVIFNDCDASTNEVSFGRMGRDSVSAETVLGRC